MLEARENASLLEEAPHQSGRGVPHQLDCDALIEMPVVAHAEEHLTHPAFADRPFDAEGTDARGGTVLEIADRLWSPAEECCSGR